MTVDRHFGCGLRPKTSRVQNLRRGRYGRFNLCNQSGLYTVLVTTDSCSSEVSGILVEDEGLDRNLAVTVDVVPASEGMADGQATVFITEHLARSGELVR